MRLLAVADPAQVFPPCCFLRVAEEIGAGNVMMVPQLAAAQAGEVRLCPVGAGAVDAVAVLVVDPLHGEPGVQRVPGRAFVGVHHGAVGDPLADGRHGGPLAAKHLRQRATIALAHHHHDPAFARPVLSPPPVDPVGRPVLWPDMAAEIGAVDPQPARRYPVECRSQERVAIPDDFPSALVPARGVLCQAVIKGALPIAFDPVGLGVCPQPIPCRDSQALLTCSAKGCCSQPNHREWARTADRGDILLPRVGDLGNASFYLMTSTLDAVLGL